MNFCVYRQNTVIKDEVPICSGEDARPFVGNSLIMVADGLGGTGAIRHSSVVKEMFDRDTVLQALFKDVYTDLDNEAFANYVKDSFVELYAIKDVYGKERPYILKKSSYFGSRIVSSVMLYHFLKDTNWDVDNIFDGLSACEEDKKKEYLMQLGERLSCVIKEDISKVAENANLIYETSIPKLKLLATTLCATIFRERENFVEAIYLMVGDSRPYFWSEEEGLCQLVEDQERADGAMNGCIHVGGDFSVSCKYFQFNKPCVLFNASDGCFESGKFLSPMAFEKLILEAIVENESIEAVENKLVSDYDIYGTHDDSSTLAMRCFGYDSFDNFKEACQRRLENIKSEYIAKMEDLLDKDYVCDLKNSMKSLYNRAISLKERLLSDDKVMEYCQNCVSLGKYPDGYSATDKVAKTYLDKIKEIDDTIEVCKAQLKNNVAIIKKLICENFIKLIPYMSISLGDRKISAIMTAEECYYKAKHKYEEKIREYRESMESTFATINEILENVNVDDIPVEFNSFDPQIFNKNKQCKKDTGEVYDFVSKIKNKKQKNIADMISVYKKYVDENKKLSDKYDADVKKLCEDIIYGRIDISKVKFFGNAYELISEAVAKFAELRKKIDFLNTEEKSRVLNETAVLMLESDFVNVFIAIVKSENISDEVLLSEAKQIFDDYSSQVSDIKEKAELQEMLFTTYEQQYGKYM